MAKIPQKIADVLTLEQKQGYLEGSVLGGFSGWLADLAPAVRPKAAADKLAELAEAYREASILERPEVWRQIVGFMTMAEFPEDPAAAKPKAPKQRAVTLAVSIEYLKGVGPKRAELLRRLGIYTMRDLLYFRPRDYEQRPAPVPIAAAEEGEPAVLCGKVLSYTMLRPNRRLTILKAVISDGTDSINAVWYNQPHLQEQMQTGRDIVVFGKAERRFSRREFTVQDYEFAEAPTDSGLLPVYPLTANLNQKSMRRLVQAAWDRYAPYITEELPEELLAPNGLLPLKEALYRLHFPQSVAEAEEGRRRLAYEELLITQLTVLGNRLPGAEQIVRREQTADKRQVTADFAAALPFALTGAQRRVIGEVLTDMRAEQPMRRLVQGDVGSGKTMIAAAALYQNFLAGRQGALMAPTEILAEQHYKTLRPLLQKLGMETALLTGDTPQAERRQVLAELALGYIDVLVGTHALFSADVEFDALGLAVTDEQHRFGVNQRNALRQKGRLADVLVLTATPIPRTLAMTFYGDLAVSALDELPPGRLPIQTFAVAYDIEERANEFIRQQLAEGRQAYIVCPLVEESENMELAAAVSLTERLKKEIFPTCQIELLYGKMKPQDKAAVMARFAAGEVQILVSTTVIEVGVDVPNATLMVIRDAERFGLAQLHQLRGRVGRGEHQSYCILLNNAKSREARERIKTLCSTTDGFMIAEADLRLRGAGELLGTRQSGLAELKYADLAKDQRLVEAARGDAMRLLQDGSYLDLPLAKEVRARSELLES